MKVLIAGGVLIVIMLTIGLTRWYLLPEVIRTDLAMNGISNRYYNSSEVTLDTTVTFGYLFQGYLKPIKKIPKEEITTTINTSLNNGNVLYQLNEKGELIKKTTTNNR